MTKFKLSISFLRMPNKLGYYHGFDFATLERDKTFYFLHKTTALKKNNKKDIPCTPFLSRFNYLSVVLGLGYDSERLLCAKDGTSSPKIGFLPQGFDFTGQNTDIWASSASFTKQIASIISRFKYEFFKHSWNVVSNAAFFEHNNLFVQADPQSSAAVFVLPDTGEIYSDNNYEDPMEHDWTDISYKENNKIDRQEYIEYEENLRRMNNIHPSLPGSSKDRKIPVNVLSPEGYSKNDIENMDQYIQYNPNNNEGQDTNVNFPPMNIRQEEFNYGPFDDPFIEESLDVEEKDEIPEYGYDFESQKNVQVNPINPPYNQLNTNAKISEGSEQPGINANNITPFNYIEKNSPPYANEENKNIGHPFKPDVTPFNPNFNAFKQPPNNNRPAGTSTIDNYNDDLSPNEMEILDKIMAQKDVQQAMLQKDTLSDANLKSILYSAYDSTSDDSFHSSNENNVNSEKEKQVSISTSGASGSTTPENIFSKSNVNNVPHTSSSLPKKDTFETGNQGFQTYPMKGLNAGSQDGLQKEVVEIQLFGTNDDEKRVQQSDGNEAVKSKADPFQIKNIPNTSIHSIPPMYLSKSSQIEVSMIQHTEPMFSVSENPAISKSVNSLPHVASITSIPAIKSMEDTSFSGSFVAESYPTESLNALSVDLELENPSNDTLESGLLQSGNLKNNTQEAVNKHSGTGKSFDPSVQIKNPNGSWSPSCKSVHKGMYCLDLDGEGSTVVECFGENIGFQFSCGNDLFCYTVSAYDVDCRAR